GHEMPTVQRLAQMVDPHSAAGQGGMDEVALAQVDGRMIDRGPAYRKVEAISRPQRGEAQGNRLAQPRLLAGSPGEPDATVPEAVLHQARAVQTARPVSTPNIRHAQVPERLPQHLGAQSLGACRFATRRGRG